MNNSLIKNIWCFHVCPVKTHLNLITFSVSSANLVLHEVSTFSINFLNLGYQFRINKMSYILNGFNFQKSFDMTSVS